MFRAALRPICLASSVLFALLSITSAATAQANLALGKPSTASSEQAGE